MAALLHDIGHLPYSHVSEFNQNNKDFTKIPKFLKWSHEEFGVHLIKNSYLKNILIEKDSDYDIDLICNLIIGNDIADNPILSRIINWELDADRLDYLLRDSHFSGVKYGIVDLNYLINNFEIFDDKLAINEKASRSIENILIARFSLYDRVYTHKTISFFEYILKKVLEDLILDDIYPSFANIKQLDEIIKTEENSERLFELTDNYLLIRCLYDIMI
ncbi:MAG: HD domain-containing protein [Promethearchaeota archaeon]